MGAFTDTLTRCGASGKTTGRIGRVDFAHLAHLVHLAHIAHIDHRAALMRGTGGRTRTGTPAARRVLLPVARRLSRAARRPRAARRALPAPACRPSPTCRPSPAATRCPSPTRRPRAAGPVPPVVRRPPPAAMAEAPPAGGASRMPRTRRDRVSACHVPRAVDGRCGRREHGRGRGWAPLGAGHAVRVGGAPGGVRKCVTTHPDTGCPMTVSVAYRKIFANYPHRSVA